MCVRRTTPPTRRPKDGKTTAVHTRAAPRRRDAAYPLLRELFGELRDARVRREGLGGAGFGVVAGEEAEHEDGDRQREHEAVDAEEVLGRRTWTMVGGGGGGGGERWERAAASRATTTHTHARRGEGRTNGTRFRREKGREREEAGRVAASL